MYGPDVGNSFVVLVVLAAIGLVFGLWKLVEIAIWFFSHIHWS